MALESTGSTQKEDCGDRNTPEKPVVVQCLSCRSILADTSTGFLEADMSTATISFSTVRGITMSQEIKTRTSGNSFNEMLCTQCGKIVGCKFISTTTQFDSIRNAYTFNKAALVTYELSGDNIPPATTNTPSSTDSMRSLHQLLDQVCESMNRLSTWMRALQTENAQLRQNFLALENRLHRMESANSDS